MVLNIQVVFFCRVCTVLGSWQGVLQSITAALYHPRAEREPGPAIGGTGASSRPALLAPSVEVEYLSLIHVYSACGTSPHVPGWPIPPAAPSTPSPFRLQCRLYLPACRGSLPTTQRLFNLCKPDSRPEQTLPARTHLGGMAGMRGCLAERRAKGIHGLISVQAPSFTGQTRW